MWAPSGQTSRARCIRQVKWQSRDSCWIGDSPMQTAPQAGNHNIYTTTQAVGFCFAINDKKSFESLHQVIEDVRQLGSEASMFLISCKGDLIPEVSDEEVRVYAEKHQLAYFRTSSLQNWGVNEVFSEMMKQGLPLRQIQLERQKQRKASLVTLKPPCRQNCQFM